jgi:hypothetical protein
MQKVWRSIRFVPFHNFFSMTMFVQLHCNINWNEPSMCLRTTLKVFKDAVVCTFTWVIECIAKGLKRFLVVFDILFCLPSIVSCVLMFPITIAQLNAKVQTLYAHIMIFGCTLTFRHSIPTYISRGFFWGQIFITWHWLRKIPVWLIIQRIFLQKNAPKSQHFWGFFFSSKSPYLDDKFQHTTKILKNS